MNERKPVVCPWCGYEMAAYKEPIQGYSGEKTCLYECAQCCARSPIAITSKDAYAAATRRPENRALTLEGMAEMDESDAVWAVAKDGTVCVVNGLDAHEYAGYEYDALYFAAKPTPEDIEAARKEEQNAL